MRRDRDTDHEGHAPSEIPGRTFDQLAVLEMETTPIPAGRSLAESAFTVAKKIAIGASCVGIVLYVWSLNYNKLGSFYDYSILIDAAGKLHAGLLPFRDYSTPLQSLSIWLAYACELLFGQRYLALAYGNLLLSLGLFFLAAHFARKVWPTPIAILTGLAVCVASSLQHGILWYNCIALLLLAAVTLKCAELLRDRSLRARDALFVAAPLLLIGMTKMNFYAVAFAAAVLFALVALATSPRLPDRKAIAIVAALALAILAGAPLIEAFANHVTLSTWIAQVIRKPASANAGELKFLFNPAFYIVDRFSYPGSVLRGAVSICCAVYICIVYCALKELRAGSPNALRDRIVRLAVIGFFWITSLLLVLTNIDTETLSLSFCLIGVLAMRISGLFRGPRLQELLQNSAMILACYFIVVGGVSIVRHARISYAFHSFPGQVIPKDGQPAYLQGVELSPQAVAQLARINDLLEKNKGVPVYWGTGVELMNRIHPGVRDPILPLWYHAKASVLESDTPAIVAALDRNGANLFVADRLFFGYFLFPDSLRTYLAREWTLEEEDYSLVVYRRKEPIQHVPPLCPAGAQSDGQKSR